jgi:2-iminobutanoate/2-iminopropanoate deaminase
MEPQRLELRRIDQSRVLPAPRFRYTPAVQAGPFVFVSGLVGLDPATEKLAHSGAVTETARILNNL